MGTGTAATPIRHGLDRPCDYPLVGQDRPRQRLRAPVIVALEAFEMEVARPGDLPVEEPLDERGVAHECIPDSREDL